MPTRARKSKANPQQKEALLSICDPENYLEIITGCLDEEQAKMMRPHHMANFMALAAELFLSNYTGIATAFEKQNGLELGFKVKLAQEKDTVDLSYKPIEVYKDSASLNLPEEEDEGQSTMDFTPKTKSGKEEPVVEAEIVPALPVPAEVLGLREPGPRTMVEEEAYSRGREAAAGGLNPDANPFDDDEALFQAWREGWHDQKREEDENEEEPEAFQESGPDEVI